MVIKFFKEKKLDSRKFTLTKYLGKIFPEEETSSLKFQHLFKLSKQFQYQEHYDKVRTETFLQREAIFASRIQTNEHDGYHFPSFGKMRNLNHDMFTSYLKKKIHRSFEIERFVEISKFW